MSFKEWLAPNTRAEQAGMFLAGASIPFTFQQTLMPRGVTDQALATGIVMAVEYAVGALVQDTVEVFAAHTAEALDHNNELEHSGWRRYSIVFDLAGFLLGTGLKKMFKQHEGENVAVSWARTIGTLITNGSIAGLSVASFQEAAHDLKLHRVRGFPLALPGGVLLAAVIDSKRRRAEHAEVTGELSLLKGWEAFALSPLVALGLAGVSVGERIFAHGISNTLSRIFRGHERWWRPVGHVGAIFSVGYAIGLIFKLIYWRLEAGADKIEPAFDKPPKSPLVSGSDESLIPWEVLSHQGRRFVSTYLRNEWIERVMCEPAEVKHPIRVFAALDGAGTDEERVELALRELERTGAFNRSLLLVVSPTGTGYVNYVAVEAAEYMTHGDIATVALQYSKRPSVLSLDRVPEGIKQYRMFMEVLHERLEKLPPDKRPRVVLFGESLGAWTSEDAFEGEGTNGMLRLGVDHGLWIGTPHATKWKDQVLGPPRDDVDKSLVGAFNDFGQVEALSPGEREKLRYVMITHYNDAVAQCGLDLLVRRPSWLCDPEKRPSTVPKTEIYGPIVTFVLTLIDMKNSANVIPGRFEAKGHDYRKDLARFVREVYRLQCHDERLDFVEKALREYELFRKEWVDEHDKSEKKNEKAPGKNNRGKQGTSWKAVSEQSEET